MLLALVLDVPVLSARIVPAGTAPPAKVVCDIVTCAELVNDPNRPKTNPAIAIAAIRVMAISMTVASTGEMAFLFLR